MRRAVGIVRAGATLILGGLAFDAAPLFVPGVGFALIGLAAPAWVWLAAGGLTIERRLSARRVVEGEPLEATIEIRGGRFWSPSSRLLDPLIAEPLVLRARGGLSKVHLIVRFPRFGVLRVEPPALVVSDPLELARRVRSDVEP